MPVTFEAPPSALGSKRKRCESLSRDVKAKASEPSSLDATLDLFDLGGFGTDQQVPTTDLLLPALSMEQLEASLLLELDSAEDDDLSKPLNASSMSSSSSLNNKNKKKTTPVPDLSALFNSRARGPKLTASEKRAQEESRLATLNQINSELKAAVQEASHMLAQLKPLARMILLHDQKKKKGEKEQ
eukprot:m.99617 g.99617  ORF g.99617 m.99617 type:complete len:186 (-) comp22185_c0_seq2:48-605(-)